MRAPFEHGCCALSCCASSPTAAVCRQRSCPSACSRLRACGRAYVPGFQAPRCSPTAGGRRDQPLHFLPAAPKRGGSPCSPAVSRTSCSGTPHAAICRLLSQCGYRVEVPANQTCCGALALHLGAEPLALALARQNLHAFAGNDGPVLVAAAGCGAVLKDYARLFAASPEQEQARAFAERVRDATEFFASLALPPAQAPPGLRVAYVDACHLAHGQGVRSAPRALLRAIGGLELVELPDEFCCGSAGSYSLFEPRIASALGARKAAAIVDRRVQLVAVANPGCALQLAAALRRAGAALPVLHPVEIYTRALDGSLSSL